MHSFKSSITCNYTIYVIQIINQFLEYVQFAVNYGAAHWANIFIAETSK